MCLMGCPPCACHLGAHQPAKVRDPPHTSARSCAPPLGPCHVKGAVRFPGPCRAQRASSRRAACASLCPGLLSARASGSVCSVRRARRRASGSSARGSRCRRPHSRRCCAGRASSSAASPPARAAAAPSWATPAAGAGPRAAPRAPRTPATTRPTPCAAAARRRAGRAELPRLRSGALTLDLVLTPGRPPSKAAASTWTRRRWARSSASSARSTSRARAWRRWPPAQPSPTCSAASARAAPTATTPTRRARPLRRRSPPAAPASTPVKPVGEACTLLRRGALRRPDAQCVCSNAARPE